MKKVHPGLIREISNHPFPVGVELNPIPKEAMMVSPPCRGRASRDPEEVCGGSSPSADPCSLWVSLKAAPAYRRHPLPFLQAGIQIDFE